MEIERQFLVDIIPSLPSGYDSILQGYVSLLPEIRIRAVRPMQGEEKFYLTVKRGAGLVREEWETAISSREFSHLVECLEKNTFFIEKRRYYLPLADGHVAEYNRHSGHLRGFDYVEVEFDNEEETCARQRLPAGQDDHEPAAGAVGAVCHGDAGRERGAGSRGG